ncbi:EamA family transporter [Nonomuraea gerenzanensis]|uniref:Putative integral membrane protein n=1 Tax=Nonomuraea gerenzanensis TaxID=93944 RepID=A0A1M4EGZ5_9ACTN|nr:EamA family transporter [Nonomuraea gerenzanensis]UBU09745.1 EamA family transporter [Nonomuraea gerenzanensis]SBO98185.1 putative integral membrane protein [Nonomuraea gerenzanensis]
MTAFALDDPIDRGPGLPRPGNLLRSAADSIPPSTLVLLGILSVQLGAGFAKELFATLPPSAVVFLRIAAGALIMGAVARPRLRGMSWRDWAVGAGFGLTLAVMNLTFYEALARLPMGIAVAIEFLGPLGVAVAASRRRIDLVWVGLAAMGVVLLAPWGESATVSWAGIGFAMVAGACWAAYILLSAAAGQRFPGTTGLSFAMIVSAVVILPIGVTTGGADLLQPELLLIGLGVGLLSSVIPYSLELQALRRMPKHVFGILMSLEPAVAALIGVLLLSEILHVQQWAAIVCIVAASLGSTRTRRG